MFVARPVAVLVCLRAVRLPLAGNRLRRAGSGCAARSASSSRRSRCWRDCRMRTLYLQRRLRRGAGLAAGAGLDAGARRARVRRRRAARRSQHPPHPARSARTAGIRDGRLPRGPRQRGAARRRAARPRSPGHGGARRTRSCWRASRPRCRRTTTPTLAPPGHRPVAWTGCSPKADEASEAEQDAFGQFILPGHRAARRARRVLRHLRFRARFAGSTAAQLFDERFDEQPQVGDRVALGPAALVVRAWKDERVTQVGLRFAGVGERLISGSRTSHH